MQMRNAFLQTFAGLFLSLFLQAAQSVPVRVDKPSLSALPTGLSTMLLAATARTKDDAWAVGCTGSRYTDECDSGYPLIEHWNGQHWQVIPGAKSVSLDSALMGVTAINKNDVWAVGSSGGYSLIEHWNGQSWQAMPFSPSDFGSGLNSVSALSRDNVWAVGMSMHSVPFVKHWNGQNWQIVSVPDGSTIGYILSDYNLPYNDLTTVNALGPRNIYISGQNLLEHWDGTMWHIIEHPVTGVTSLSALASNDIWASDSSYSVSSRNMNDKHIAHWNGKCWQFFALPIGDERIDYKSSLLAIHDSDVWTVNHSWDSRDDSHITLIGHWNGHIWQQAPSLKSSLGGSTLASLAASSSSDVWAVGSMYKPLSSYQFSTHHPLIEHWNGTNWQIIDGPNL